MTRSFQIAAIALALMTGSVAAHAQTARLAYNPADLATAAGREAVRANISAVADSYCRANPVGGTVAACRQDVAAQLGRVLEVRAVEYAKAQAGKSVQVAQR